MILLALVDAGVVLYIDVGHRGTKFSKAGSIESGEWPRKPLRTRFSDVFGMESTFSAPFSAHSI